MARGMNPPGAIPVLGSYEDRTAGTTGSGRSDQRRTRTPRRRKAFQSFVFAPTTNRSFDDVDLTRELASRSPQSESAIQEFAATLELSIRSLPRATPDPAPRELRSRSTFRFCRRGGALGHAREQV